MFRNVKPIVRVMTAKDSLFSLSPSEGEHLAGEKISMKASYRSFQWPAVRPLHSLSPLSAVATAVAAVSLRNIEWH